MLGSVVHTDQCAAEWGMGYTSHRQDWDGDASSAPGSGSGTKERDTRRHEQRLTQNIPPHGGDYVDFRSHTIVRAAANTMTAFHPGDLHGTTRLFRTLQEGICKVHQRSVVEAYRMSLEAPQGVASIVCPPTTISDDAGLHGGDDMEAAGEEEKGEEEMEISSE